VVHNHRFEEVTVAMGWAITIEGKNEFGDVCRREVQIDKSWERLHDGEIGLSIDDCKKIMAALQSAVVNHEADTYVWSRSGRCAGRFTVRICSCRSGRRTSMANFATGCGRLSDSQN
jgi:hypothetical protein